MAMDSQLKAKYAKRMAEHTLESQKQRLIQAAQWLAADLNKLAAEMANTNPSFNSLGVVQGRGSEVDRMCGEIKAHMDLIKLLDKIAEKEEEEQ